MKSAIVIATVLSLVLAAVITLVGFHHNAMGEFCLDDISAACELDLGYTLGIFASWFCAAFIVLRVLGGGVMWLWRTRKEVSAR